ncbi:hypothetical protein AO072_14445 [Pseudomonas syringae ICMP 13102]|nr:hypothetical protein AO072_14445 [Pseudomonas syringae ICMP 13102]PBP63560.1 hypothetical protein CCL21_26100 [Pseudomonas syringae]
MPDLDQIINNHQLLSDTIVKLKVIYASEDPVVVDLLEKLNHSLVAQHECMTRLYELSILDTKLAENSQPVLCLVNSNRRSIF